MKEKLFQPVDIAILVYFRILGAALIAGELFNVILLGEIEEYGTTTFHFSYYLFPWLNPWHVTGMYLHYFLAIAAALMVSAGIMYRFSTICLFFLYTSLFLMGETDYINHTYLYSLISFLMIFMPLHKAVSYDTYIKPSIKTAYAPAWCYYLLLFQMSVVYFFAGLAKINVDWLNGVPMNFITQNKVDTFLLGNFFRLPESHYIMSYFGLAFDLFIVPAL